MLKYLKNLDKLLLRCLEMTDSKKPIISGAEVVQMRKLPKGLDEKIQRKT